MKTRTLIGAFIAVLAVFLVGIVSAEVTSTSSIDVTFNDVAMVQGNSNVAGFAGETVPVKVGFSANEDASDVKVRVEIYGGNDESVVTSSRFTVVSGKFYTKLFNLQLPATLKDTTKDLTLKVRVYSPDSEVIALYTIAMQRQSYELDVLSVDYDQVVSAGDSVPVSVVVKNTGFENANDGFVKVTVPSLGVSKKAYFADLVSVENDSSERDNRDSVEKVITFSVPESAKAGVYDMVVEVYDGDVSVKEAYSIKVDGSASTETIAVVKSQDIRAGETVTYDMILVNSADKIKVFSLKPIAGSDLEVSVPSVITVGPSSSTTVKVTVRAANDLRVGTYTFAVSVNGETVPFSANVTGKSADMSAIILTIVLVIVFIALLAVLIVLLTRKDKQVQEVETSYY